MIFTPQTTFQYAKTHTSFTELSPFQLYQNTHFPYFFCFANTPKDVDELQGCITIGPEGS